MFLNSKAPRETFLKLRKVSRILGVRVALISMLSVVAALSAELLDPLLPEFSKDRFSEEAILPILEILASGMLAVATFSLGVMVSSYRSLAANTTPRIHKLLMEDTSTQSVLATFIGSFVFSLTAIILFRADFYSDSASVVVFLFTVLIVMGIVFSLVRWIHKLSQIGSMEYALDRAERTARETLAAHAAQPLLGGCAWHDETDIPDGAKPVKAPSSGYVAFINVSSLQKYAEENDAQIFLALRPGVRVLKGKVLAHVKGAEPDDKIADAFAIRSGRSYEQDPLYALQALRETASRALSPAINDPGTAKEVITRLEVLLYEYLQKSDEVDEKPEYDRVHVLEIGASRMIDTALRDLVRDGAGFEDVLVRVAKALKALHDAGDKEARSTVESIAREMVAHAEKALRTKDELERFRAALDIPTKG